MKVIFVGRKWSFNVGLANWLAGHFDLRAVFYVETKSNSVTARLREYRDRVRRRGIVRTCDEVLFQLFYRVWHEQKENRRWHQHIPREFRINEPPDVPTFDCDDIHNEYWLRTIKELDPDIIFSVCTRTLFRKELYALPRFGSFVLHEGVTPEYRGLNTIARALLRSDWDHIGFTLLKMDEGIDSGPIVCQGIYRNAKEFGFQSGLIGHLAVISGLPEVKRALNDLYLHQGRFDPVPQTSRTSKCYTWMSFSEYVQLLFGYKFRQGRPEVLKRTLGECEQK
jgi:hypothetical protein